MMTCTWPAFGCACFECEAERDADEIDRQNWTDRDDDWEDEPSYAYGGPNEK